MTWRKINSKTNYLDFIRSIDGEIITDPLATDLPEKAIFIRHDIDADIDHALLFAEMEYRNNIESTYYLLHTAGYFDYSDDFGEKITMLAGMEHEVGFHNDVLSVWNENKTVIDAEATLLANMEYAISYLRMFCKVKGTSCHGAREHYDRQYFNYQLWTQWNVLSNEGFLVRWPQISLKTVGLEYEAYFLPYTHYFSDSGNNWIGYIARKPKPFERTALYSKDNLGTNVINEWNKAEKGLFQLLIHPQHWEEV